MDLEHRNPKKNALSIRLTESAVFLSTDIHPQARSRSTEHRPTLLRGLLILNLVKPTKITSIEVELTATTTTAWPEGIGARRIEVTEEHRVFHASTLYFRARKSYSASRRTASIGPGIYYNKIDNPNHDDDWDGSLRGNEALIHTTASAATPSRYPSGININNEINTPSQRFGDLPQISIPTPPSRPFFLNQRSNRRLSADWSHFQRMSLQEPHEMVTDLHMQQLAPIPPYTLFAPPVTSDSSRFSTAPDMNGNMNAGVSTHSPTSPIFSFEDFRYSPFASLRGTYRSQRSQSRTGSLTVSGRSVIPEDDIIESEPNTNPSTDPPTPRSPIHTPFTSTPSSPIHVPPLDSSSAASTSQEPLRGRKRFSFSAVSNVIIDAVRSSSPRKSQIRQSREREYERHRERSVDTTAGGQRGRTMERGSEPVNLNWVGNALEKDPRHVKEKGWGVMAMLMGERENEKEKEKASAEGWKEFKKGTYTFPISFSIPSDAPPTMTCDYGSVSWRLKASVHRPGTFQTKMTAVQDVIIVTCPTEDDTEDTESIIVERHWDQQLQYLISISGRSFHVGGTVPVTFTLMPLTKINVHRLSVVLEERVDYYTNMKRIARTDPIVRFTLLSVQGDDNRTPILPLQSDDPDALCHSPLFALIDPGDDLSEVASNLMGPGPWTLHRDLKLPGSCSVMRFTNRNRKSNITVTHTLKLIMRVERGDNLFIDGKTGKRKLFDIVVQTPVLILSCRCNPDWICLPRYSEVRGLTTIVPSCPCRASRLYSDHTSAIEAISSGHSSDSSTSFAETSSVNPSSSASSRQLDYNEAIIRSSSLFERLVSGQESVSGETPPAYDVGSRPATNGVART